jgi:hypothetical protein
MFGLSCNGKRDPVLAVRIKLYSFLSRAVTTRKCPTAASIECKRDCVKRSSSMLRRTKWNQKQTYQKRCCRCRWSGCWRGVMAMRSTTSGGTAVAPGVRAAEAALGAHPCAALSSARVLPEWTQFRLASSAFAANDDDPLNFVSQKSTHCTSLALTPQSSNLILKEIQDIWNILKSG